MVITITGLPGSGKSTIAKLLSEQLRVPWYSMGDLRGKMAQERNMTIDELNKLGETESFTDKEVDEYQTQLGNSGQSFVIDGRLSWYFIPNSFKVFLNVNPEIGSQRIFNSANSGKRSDEKQYVSSSEVQRVIETRVQSDKKRYQQYYGVDFMDSKQFDLVIDTSYKSPQEVLQEIITHLPS